MTRIQFLLDGNVSPAIKRALLDLEPAISIWCVGDPGVPPRGTSDPDILDWCERHGFLLVTNNRSTMPVHLADHLASDGTAPGVLVIRRS